MAIELTDLRVFIAVTDHGSFSRAATALVMSQPSVSERIAGLEHDVGTTLFDRTARGAAPTAAGRRFEEYARRCVALADDAVGTALEEARTPWLRVAVHTTFAHRVLPIVLRAAEQEQCRLWVHDAHTDEVQHRVVDGRADVGFVLMGPIARGLSARSLPADPVVCVVRADHPLVRRRTLHVADLAGSPLAVNVWGVGAADFLRGLEQLRFPAPSVRRLSDARSAALLALAHDHVAVLTASSVATEVERGDLAVLEPVDFGPWSVRIALVYRSARARDPVVSAVAAAARRRSQ